MVQPVSGTTAWLRRQSGWLTKLGQDANPILPVVIYTLFDATVPPSIIMANKKEAFENRRYTAVRRIVTEVIGLGVCLVASKVSRGMLANLFMQPRHTELTRTPTRNLFAAAGILLADFAIPVLANVAMRRWVSPLLYKGAPPAQAASVAKNPAPGMAVPTVFPAVGTVASGITGASRLAPGAALPGALNAVPLRLSRAQNIEGFLSYYQTRPNPFFSANVPETNKSVEASARPVAQPATTAA